MGGVLRLRRFELDLNGLLLLGHVELLTESLIVLGDYLDENLTLGDRWNGGDAVLIGLQLPTGADLLAELNHRAAFNEPDQHTSPINRLVLEVPNFNAQLGSLTGCAESARHQGDSQ